MHPTTTDNRGAQRERRVAQHIIQQYERNVFYLPQKELGHFFQRAYCATGDKKYERVIAQYFCITKMPLLARHRAALCLYRDTQQVPAPTPAPTHNPRQRARAAMYERYPSVAFFNDVLQELFLVSLTKLHHTHCQKTFADIVNVLRTVDFDAVYNDAEKILVGSSFVINSVFYLSELGLDATGLKDKAVRIVRNHYFDARHTPTPPSDVWEYQSMIYSLTHIIIAQSNYYERSVDDHMWIIDFFNDAIDDIIAKTTFDIIAEVGLCIKLTNQETRCAAALARIKNHIIQHYDFHQNVDVHFVRKEHTNSIIMLLFRPNTHWHARPDLSREDDVFHLFQERL